MSIGTGIFLGCLFIGTILLYFKTSETWPWAKIFKRSFIGLAALITLFFLGLGSLYLKEKWDSRPTVVTSFKDISIGENYSEVVFKVGFFEKQNRTEGVMYNDEKEEDYFQKASNISFSTVDGKVKSIQYSCKQDYDYASLNGVQCGDSSESIINKFGSKVRVLCSKDTGNVWNAFRVYDLVDFGVRFRLVLNKVDSISVFKPEELSEFNKFNWLPCKN